jgi:F-type H+-transporting ATPase subunit epsilon
VRGGFAEVNADQVTVLAEEAVILAEVNVDELDQRIRNTQEDLGLAKSDDEREQIAATLEHLRQLRAAV